VLISAVTVQRGAFAQDLKVVTVVPGQKSAEVSIMTDQELLVRLPRQPGTGFSWQLLSSPSMVKLEAQSSEVPGQSRPGTRQVQAFRFQATGVGQDTLRFSYRRPWEKETPPAQIFSLAVTVKTSN
jgi:inhibitor of cysteine peptidase